MIDRPRLLRVLEESSDPENPGPDEILEILQRTSRVAVVGMSRDPGKPARRIPSYLAAHGWDVIPVNPHANRILGKAARPNLAQVDEEVDMVILFRPSDEVGPFIEEAAARPERPVIWLQEGIRSDPEARSARGQGIMVVQDLCIFKVHRLLDGDEPTVGLVRS
jgi:predicted CoA-binding protein